MKWLLDNSVFLPLVDTAHKENKAMTAWFLRERASGWAVTSETYLGIARNLMHPVIMQGRQLNARDSIKVARAIINAAPKGKIILGGDPDDAVLEKAQGHRQIMDFYLVQVARDHNLKLVTRDDGILATFPAIAVYPS